MGNLEENILCIKSEILFEKEKWEGLKTEDLDSYYKLLLEESTFRKRKDLENDPSYKQIIPRVVLKYGDKYFLHRQVKANESRLNSLCPLPLGGHVEEFDLGNEKDILQTALEREVEEEADVKANIIDRKFSGLMYIEDENLVNHMHVGLFYIFTLDSDNVEMKEEGLETIGFVDTEYLNDHIEELTYWSRIFVKEYLINE